MQTKLNALHEYISELLIQKLEKHRVVTWYDPTSEFVDFVIELCNGKFPESGTIGTVRLQELNTNLCVSKDSFFEVKFTVEPLVNGETPEPLIIYLPGRVPDDDSAVLMELELAGERWQPQLKREARKALKSRFGDGQIDQILDSRVTYGDVAAVLEARTDIGSSGPLLNIIFADTRGNNSKMLATWIATDKSDPQIIEKGANQELIQLIQSRLGLQVSAEDSLQQVRRQTARYVLLSEFRNDLRGIAPTSLELIPRPSAKQVQLVLDVAKSLRERHPQEYAILADSIEREMSLTTLNISPEDLGSIDTFRFEEQVLLEHVGNLITLGRFDQALEIVSQRRVSFWALHQIQRQEQWQAFELCAELGLAITQIQKLLPDSSRSIQHWIDGYTAKDGWYRADLLHRRLEATLAVMTNPIVSETVIHRIRSDYEELVDKMTRGFVNSLKQAGWTVPSVLHQTQVYAKEVHNPTETVCLVLVDALRYEMAVELGGLLEGAVELNLKPAVAAVPTITQIGMAALMPGAEQSFSVVEHAKDIGASINGSVTATLMDRKKFWKGRVPKVIDLELDNVLSHSNAQLQKRVAGSPLVIVRSVEIDAMGEGGNTYLARQVMDTAINNVARAIKRLAVLGIARFVVVADHGHLFIHPRDESQRIEKPGGHQVTLHRRCWAGRGGSTPASTVRISANQVGYDSDLDFVFPTNNAVFKSGGDLAYYHGGLSMQELLIPVLSLRMHAPKREQNTDVELKLSNVPKQIVNRIVTFGLSAQPSLFLTEDILVRPVLLCNGQHVGHVGMVLDAEHDKQKQCVKLKPAGSCTIGIQLLRDDIDEVEIVILDPDTDRVLSKSSKIPVKLAI